MNYLENFTKFPAIKAKKILFLLNLEQNFELVNCAELNEIEAYYQVKIKKSNAKSLANKLKEAYDKQNPGKLLTKYEAEKLSDINFRKIYFAFGESGLDYILSQIKIAKKHINDESNINIDECQLLTALRWDEKREGKDVNQSNLFHHNSGLSILGFKDTAVILEGYSSIIANLYELVSPDSAESFNSDLSIRQIKIHFISKAQLIYEFYSMPIPKEPAGLERDDKANELLLRLAKKDILKNSDEIIAYFEEKKEYDQFKEKFDMEFTEKEKLLIISQKEKVLNLISDEW